MVLYDLGWHVSFFCKIHICESDDTVHLRVGGCLTFPLSGYSYGPGEAEFPSAGCLP